MLESFLFPVDAGGTSRRSKDLQNLIVLVRYPSKRIQRQGCIKRVNLVENVEKNNSLNRRERAERLAANISLILECFV